MLASSTQALTRRHLHTVATMTLFSGGTVESLNLLEPATVVVQTKCLGAEEQ